MGPVLDVDGAAQLVATVRAEVDAAGRSDDPFEITMQAAAAVDAELLAAYEAVGVDRLIVSPFGASADSPDTDAADWRPSVDRLGELYAELRAA
jgi:hypothetical protein